VKKKILFVTNHFRFSNGVATVLRNLIANLDTDYYDISLLAIYEFNEEFAAPIMDRIHVVPGFNFYFRGFDKFVNMIPPRRIYKKFIKEKYDLEVAFQFGIPTKCIAVSENPHKLCWMHTYDANMVLRDYYKKFPKVVNVAKAGRDKMINAGFDKEMCDYTYNIIDETHILNAACEENPISKTKKYSVVTVARLAPDKAFMRYLECIKEITKQINNVEFWIVGGGSEEEKMRQYIKDNHLEEYVIMTGKQTNPYKYVKDADLYFCCSYREGFSTSCQEAALLGIPVVSVEVDGAHELKELSGCGCVIDNDENSIQNELVKILKNDEKIARWKEQAAVSKNTFYKAERLKKADEILKASISEV
jgi:glycosyltransferase involved in cell wall biosynthesis